MDERFLYYSTAQVMLSEESTLAMQLGHYTLEGALKGNSALQMYLWQDSKKIRWFTSTKRVRYVSLMSGNKEISFVLIYA